MPPFPPFGSDTLAVPAYLVSDENDPAYRAWLAEHPDAFAAGTWTRAPRRPRALPPDVSRSRSTDYDPAATVPTRDLVARSDLSTAEFSQIAATSHGRSAEFDSCPSTIRQRQAELDRSLR